MSVTATKEAPQSTVERQGFKQITGATGTALFVKYESANHPNSMKTLVESDLSALKYPEALLLLMKDETLKNALKEKWFWLSGQGTEKNGLFTINDKGELVEREGSISIEKTVRVWRGTNPLSLDVYSDDGVALGGGRFSLGADCEPSVVAPVVVGVAKDFKLELKPEEPSRPAEREVAVPKTTKIAPELLARAESSVAKLEAAEQAGALAQGITSPLKDLLRVLN